MIADQGCWLGSPTWQLQVLTTPTGNNATCQSWRRINGWQILLWYQKCTQSGAFPKTPLFVLGDLKWGLFIQPFMIPKSCGGTGHIWIIWGSFLLGRSLESSYQGFLEPLGNSAMPTSWGSDPRRPQGATSNIPNLCVWDNGAFTACRQCNCGGGAGALVSRGLGFLLLAGIFTWDGD